MRAKSFILVCVLLAFGLVVSANAYTYTNSFDSLDGLTAGTGTTIEIDNGTYMEGTGSVKMSWDSGATSATSGRGYFDWALPKDPDLTDAVIKFNVLAPAFITTVSLELIDAAGEVAEAWYWDMAAFADDVFLEFTVVQGNASGADTYILGTGDITNIVAIRFDEVDVVYDGRVYNYWDYLTITSSTIPEPATILMLTLGGLLLRRRK